MPTAVDRNLSAASAHKCLLRQYGTAIKYATPVHEMECASSYYMTQKRFWKHGTATDKKPRWSQHKPTKASHIRKHPSLTHPSSANLADFVHTGWPSADSLLSANTKHSPYTRHSRGKLLCMLTLLFDKATGCIWKIWSRLFCYILFLSPCRP